MIKVFVDGKEGTTGLRIADRLRKRPDIELLEIDESKRKDSAERKKYFAAADIAFLCLPDAAAVEAAELSRDCNVRLIDTSTAHRTAADWVYGFPELSADLRNGIKTSSRVAVPGCHASGFIAMVSPLTEAGIIRKDALLTAFSLTGYSGGGKKMIAQYENEKSPVMATPGIYALGQTHKHLKEMTKITGLQRTPLFSPMVCDYYSGMIVTLPLYTDLLNGKPSLQEVQEKLAAFYEGEPFIQVMPLGSEDETNGFLAGNARSGWDGLEIFVTGNEDRILLSSRFDNLGKGASGAAIQCMNIVMGVDEKKGLNL